MIVFGIMLLVMAAAFTFVSVSVYRGNTNLIHDYHRTNVSDRAAYGKAFGKALGIMPVSFLISGILALAGKRETLTMVSVGILCLGLAISLVLILRVQKKYNGGVF